MLCSDTPLTLLIFIWLLQSFTDMSCHWWIRGLWDLAYLKIMGALTQQDGSVGDPFRAILLIECIFICHLVGLKLHQCTTFLCLWSEHGKSDFSLLYNTNTYVIIYLNAVDYMTISTSWFFIFFHATSNLHVHSLKELHSNKYHKNKRANNT